MYYGRYSIAFPLIMIIVGIGLAWNSARGLLSREGMYDAESAAQMTLASWVGLIGGILLAAAGGWMLLNGPLRLLF